MPTSKQSAEIHRRLDTYQPIAHIAAETGMSPSQIHRHKRGACSCAGRAPAAGPTTAPAPDTPEAADPWAPAPDTPEAADPWAPAPEAPVGNWLRFGFVVGQHDEGLAEAFGMSVPDVEAEITPGTRLELECRTQGALEAVGRRNPAQWLRITEQRRNAEREAEEAAAKAIGTELLAAFLGEIIAYQARLWPADDFLEWLTWLRELVQYRYPRLLPVLAVAVADAETSPTD